MRAQGAEVSSSPLAEFNPPRFVHFPLAFRWLNGKESAYNAGDVGLIPGSGRSPGRRNGNPLQYSCLENSMEPNGLQSMGSQRVGHA